MPVKLTWDSRFGLMMQFRAKAGGAEGDRTPDLLIANEALYQLSYGPNFAPRQVPGSAKGAAHKERGRALSRRRTRRGRDLFAPRSGHADRVNGGRLAAGDGAG